MILESIAEAIIRRAKKTPYFHLFDADGSLYMERFWLRPYSEDRTTIAARVHHIARPDRDRALHDHPWDFVSIVLRGGYVEARPQTTEPIWHQEGEAGRFEESCTYVYRRAGSIAYRRATERHRIVEVEENTWTLFLTGPKRQWWGFHTPEGKIHWERFSSEHNTAPVEGGKT